MDKPCEAQTRPTASGWEITGKSLGLTLLFAGCIFCAWILIEKVAFNNYAIWDDEGYFILILRQFLKNGGLYVKTFSQYGPFYTLVESSLHRLFGLPADLDGGRILTVSYILGSSVLLSVFVGRLTRKLALAFPCFVLSVMITAPILREPGHPQGIIAVLMGVALCLSLLVGSGHENAGLILLGAAAGAVALTKINVGLFFCFGLALPLTMTLAKSRFRSLLLALIIIGSFCMPPVLMSAYLRGWAGPFCLYMLISLAALYIGIFQSETPNALRPIQVAYPVLGFVAASVPILVWAVLTGSTPASLVSGIVIRALGQRKLFYAEHVIPASGLLLLLLPVLGLAVIPVARRRIANFGVWLAGGKLAIALIAAACFVRSPDSAMFYSLPILPFLLLPSGRASRETGGAFPRLFLVSLIVFEMLQAYPVLDTHHNALTASGAWICLLLHDGWSELGSLRPETERKASLARSPVIFAWLCLILASPVLFWRAKQLGPTRRLGSGSSCAQQQLGKRCRRIPIWICPVLVFSVCRRAEQLFIAA